MHARVVLGWETLSTLERCHQFRGVRGTLYISETYNVTM